MVDSVKELTMKFAKEFIGEMKEEGKSPEEIKGLVAREWKFFKTKAEVELGVADERTIEIWNMDGPSESDGDVVVAPESVTPSEGIKEPIEIIKKYVDSARAISAQLSYPKIRELVGGNYLKMAAEYIENNTDKGFVARNQSVLTYLNNPHTIYPSPDMKPHYEMDEIFQWCNRFYLRIQNKPLVFFVIDFDRRVMEEVFVRYDKEEQEYEETRTTTLTNFCVEEITEYKPFTDGTPALYQTDIKVRNGGTKALQPMNLFELAGELKGIGGAVLKTNQISDILNKAIALSREVGMIIERKDPPYPGFFWIDGELVCTRKYVDPSATEVRKALELLHDFADNFDQFHKQLSYVLHWILMAPYSFVKKQKGHSDKLGAMYLYGTSRAGKTIFGLLASHIWDLKIDDFMIAAGALHSAPSFGKKMSESTFPILLDEGESVIDPRGDLSAIFKNAVFYKNVRGRYNPSSGKYENIPALSAPMITSNNSQPTNAALGARLNTLEFTMGKVRTDKEIEEFNNIFDPENDEGELRALKAIGEFVANYVELSPDILDMPWKEAAKCLWEAVYDCGGQEIPEWLAEIGEANGLSEAYEAEEEEIFTQFRRLVLRKAEVYKGKNKDNSPIPVTAEDKTKDVILNSKETWISRVNPSRGKHAGKVFVEIDGGICSDFKKEYGLNISLKILTAKLGGDITVVKRGARSVKVGRWLYGDFLKMMETQEVEDEKE